LVFARCCGLFQTDVGWMFPVHKEAGQSLSWRNSIRICQGNEDYEVQNYFCPPRDCVKTLVSFHKHRVQQLGSKINHFDPTCCDCLSVFFLSA
jgi:hypothetical protein